MKTKTKEYYLLIFKNNHLHGMLSFRKKKYVSILKKRLENNMDLHPELIKMLEPYTIFETQKLKSNVSFMIESNTVSCNPL